MKGLMGKERVVEDQPLFISVLYVSVCIVNRGKQEKSSQSRLIPSRRCLVWSVPYLNVQVVLLCSGNYRRSLGGCKETVSLLGVSLSNFLN